MSFNSRTKRVRPKTFGLGQWLLLLALSLADAFTANQFLKSIGTHREANPIVVAIWESSGLTGLLILKIATAGILGLMLAVLATRLALASMTALAGFTLWATVSNMKVFTVAPSLAAGLTYGPLPAIVLASALFVLTWSLFYPRHVERRRLPRLPEGRSALRRAA